MSRIDVDVRDRWLLVAVFLGPAAWAVLHVALYYVVPGANEYGRVAALRTMAAASLVFPLVSGAIAVRELKLGTGDQSETVLQRRRFLAIAALVGAAFSLLLIVGNAIPLVMLEPGAEP